MKRIFPIIVCMIGLLAVLTAPMVPHHHHGEEMCVTSHGHHGEGEDCTSCVKNSYGLDVKAGSNRTVPDISVLPLFVLFGYEWHVDDVGIDELRKHVCRSTISVLQGYGGASGLRAPPCFS